MTVNGREHAAVKIHPPFVWLGFTGAALLLHRIFPLATTSMEVRWLGVFIGLLGILIAFLAVWRFFAARTTLHPHGSVSALLTGGPYRFSRNPIYIGYVLAEVGLPLALGNLWGLTLALPFVLAMNRLVIQPEEHYLRERFPIEYGEYSARVRRWL